MDTGSLAFLVALLAPCDEPRPADATPQAAPAPAPKPAPAPADLEPRWTFDVSAYTINPPDDSAYASTVVRADRAELHLEGRWNYEDLHTGSFWAGWNLEWPAHNEDDLGFAVTPMIGIVSGDTDGWAPGAEVDVTWRCFELYTEAEYLFASGSNDNDYYYSWTELTASPIDWLKFGIVGQRTNTFDSDLSLDRGLLLGLSFKRITGTIYWMDPDRDDDYVMLSIGFAF